MGEGYARPPIVEAIVELRFGGAARQSDLQNAKDRLAGAYEKVEDIQQITMEFSLDQTKSPQAILVGHKLTSADGTGVVQISESVFGFSQLPPYTGWPSVEERARAALRKAGSLYAKRPVVRAALRYIIESMSQWVLLETSLLMIILRSLFPSCRSSTMPSARCRSMSE